MATFRKIPARIMTVDYIGIPTSQSEAYRKRAEAELSKLEGQITRGKLSQGTRKTTIAHNVVVECTVMFELVQAVVIIGGGVEEKLIEDPCFCCAPCIVAGLVLEPTAPLNEETQIHDYTDETIDHWAEILICQAGSKAFPKKVILVQDRGTDGAGVRTETVVLAQAYGTHTVINAIYSDYTRHQPGDSVLVLVQPLWGFTTYPGVYSPCLNNRQVAEEEVAYPYPDITEAFINSSGVSCQISTDEQIWDETYNDLEIPPDPPADEKYNPFRVLPITIKSCLS